MPGLRSNLIAIGLALIIFGAGALAGAMVDRHWLRSGAPSGPHGSSHDAHLEAFRSQLDLTDEQARRISEIMQRTRAAAQRIRAEQHPSIQQLHEQAQREVLEQLTEDQALKYRQMIEHSKHSTRGHSAMNPH